MIATITQLTLLVCVTVKFLQRTRDGDSNSVEILRDLDHIETAATQMEQHLGEIIAYVEDVIVSCIYYYKGRHGTSVIAAYR